MAEPAPETFIQRIVFKACSLDRNEANAMIGHGVSSVKCGFGLAIMLLGWAAASASAQPSAAELLIDAGHWTRARAIVEARLREAPDSALDHFLLSQIRNAFGDRSSPLSLAEKAVTLDGKTAKYHRQVAEVLGVMAQHANPIQQLLLARRFRREIET